MFSSKINRWLSSYCKYDYLLVLFFREILRKGFVTDEQIHFEKMFTFNLKIKKSLLSNIAVDLMDTFFLLP